MCWAIYTYLLLYFTTLRMKSIYAINQILWMGRLRLFIEYMVKLHTFYHLLL